MERKTNPKLLPLKGALQGLYACTICLAALFQLQFSCGATQVLGAVPFRSLVWNILILGGVYVLVSLPWKRICTGGILFSTLVCVLGIINHYTLSLHGGLFTVEQIANARTALSVIGSYNLFASHLLLEVGRQLGFLLGCLLLSFGEYALCERRLPAHPLSRRIRAGSSLALVCIAGILVCTRGLPYLESARNSWHPSLSVANQGYPVMLASGLLRFELPVPEGYSQQALAAIPMPTLSKPEAEPADIILILNETFFDPAVVTEVNTDIDYLSGISHLEGAVLGSAVVQSGGRTNVTEAELLTGNSQSVVGGTPFNVLDMANTASIVSLLKEQGYYTIGTHCMDGANYRRSTGYAAMGFDETHFWEDYRNLETYGHRVQPTDKTVYANLIGWYEAAASRQQPVFAYCLTMQNHGDWQNNPPEDALVQVETDFGATINPMMTEFLSCIHLSDQAFVQLCDYFRQVDRKVIVCMLGDHSPAFIDSITTKPLAQQRQIAQATVPLVIWSNFDLEVSQSLEPLSATAIAPLLVSLAGAQNSPYFQYILNLTQAYPVITGWGEYTDASGQVHAIEPAPAGPPEIWNYLYLAHNNLLPESMEQWFHIAPEKEDPS